VTTQLQQINIIVIIIDLRFKETYWEVLRQTELFENWFQSGWGFRIVCVLSYNHIVKQTVN